MGGEYNLSDDNKSYKSTQIFTLQSKLTNLTTPNTSNKKQQLPISNSQIIQIPTSQTLTFPNWFQSKYYQGKTLEMGVPQSVETRRSLIKQKSLIQVVGTKIRRRKIKYAVNIVDLNNYSQTQISDLERKFKHITSNNVIIKEKPSGTQKKFFV